jgi:hypothetical protein
MKRNHFRMQITWKAGSFLAILITSIVISGAKNPHRNADSLATTKNTLAGPIGSGWVDITATEEKQRKIHLENYHKPSLNNISAKWDTRGTRPYYMEGDFDTTSVFNNDVTAGYVYDPTTLTHTHTLYKFPGNRSEIRLAGNYSTGTRQFEGYVTINDKLWGSAVFQIWGSETGATQLLIDGDSRVDGGRLWVVYDRKKQHSTSSNVIATGANNKELRINVIHLQEDKGNRVYVYVNGVEKFWYEDSEAPKNGNYMKFGCYGREDDPQTKNLTNAQVKWRSIRLWEGGTIEASK